MAGSITASHARTNGIEKAEWPHGGRGAAAAAAAAAATAAAAAAATAQSATSALRRYPLGTTYM